MRERCRTERPQLRFISGTKSQVRCHFSEEIDPRKWQPSEDVELPTIRDEEKDQEPILELDNLKKYYEVKGNSLRDVLGLGDKRYVKAVEGASFEVRRGKTLGIVGESGCGKSTLIKTIIGLERATGGKGKYLGFDITKEISKRDKKLIEELQMVFQNPDSTMNPSYSDNEVVKILKAMRLSEGYYDRLPRQLSGGEKQRIGIARALASYPDLVLCDEPVSALDVSVQAAILNLLLDVQHQFNTTLLFIAHDLSVVRFFSDQVAVMYLGQIMEIGPAEAIYRPPYHPYTEALLSAVPIPDPSVTQKRIRLEGSVPSAINPPSGCRFHTRCPRRHQLPDPQICLTDPPLREVTSGHKIYCHHDIETLSSFERVITS